MPILPGLWLLHRRRVPLPGREVLLAFIWGSLLILTVAGNRMERYLHPLYPLLCLVGVWGVRRLVPPRARGLALAGTWWGTLQIDVPVDERYHDEWSA